MHKIPFREFETLAQAARRLKRSPARLRQLVASGEIKGATKVGHAWIIPAGYKLPVSSR